MSKRLRSLLLEEGVVSALRMAQALDLQSRRRGCLDTCLLELRAIDEPSLLPYLSRAAELPVLADGLLGTQRPLPEVLALFPQTLAERFSAVPAQLLSDGVLQVLVTVDAEASELETLSHILAYRIEPWVVCEFRYHEALSLCFGQALPARFAELLVQSQRTRQRRAVPVPLWKGHLPRFGSLDAPRTLLAQRPTEPVVEPVVEPSVEPSVEPAVRDPEVVTVKEHLRRQYYGPGRSLVRWITVKSYSHRRAASGKKSS